MAAIDPVTLEVLRNRLDSIAEEIQLTLLRSSYSVILKEGEDCSAAVFNAAGEIIAQSTALPQHMGAFIPALARIIAEFPLGEMQPGDIYCMNDPHDGGTHLPDLVVAMPVFVERGVVAFSVCLAHQEDIGGKVPGSMPTDSTEIFEEGLIIPPSQLHLAGMPNRTLLKLIERNVRLPRMVLGDIAAQIAAVSNGARRIEQLFAAYGSDTVLAYMRHLLDYAEQLTRARIAEIPDGVYSFTDYMDNDGIDLDRRVSITATVTIRGDEAVVDYEGTSPQVAGPINAPLSGAQASAYFALRCVTDPGLPNNHGCYRPVTVRVPNGSLLDPWPGAPVAIRAHTLKRAADTVLGALVQAIPDRISAAPAGSISCVSLHYRLRCDGGGAGCTRGGTGVERAIVVTEGEITASYRSERHFTSPWGLFGGWAGARWHTWVERAAGGTEEIASKARIALHEGDVLALATGGGGGYGPPWQRNPLLVAEDVCAGKVSRTAAWRDYGVAIGEDGGVDDPATARRRDELAAANPDRGIFDRGSRAEAWSGSCTGTRWRRHGRDENGFPANRATQTDSTPRAVTLVRRSGRRAAGAGADRPRARRERRQHRADRSIDRPVLAGGDPGPRWRAAGGRGHQQGRRDRR
jgi:N-methylhydantoinase B